MADTPGEPLFRASKRRKVFRKRPDEDEIVASVAPASSSAFPNEPSRTYLAPDDVEDANTVTEASRGGLVKHRRIGQVRRAGVGFSSGQATSVAVEEGDDNLTIVVAEPNPSTLDMSASRFMAPTGQAAVKEDKHM